MRSTKRKRERSYPQTRRHGRRKPCEYYDSLPASARAWLAIHEHQLPSGSDTRDSRLVPSEYVDGNEVWSLVDLCRVADITGAVHPTMRFRSNGRHARCDFSGIRVVPHGTVSEDGPPRTAELPRRTQVVRLFKDRLRQLVSPRMNAEGRRHSKRILRCYLGTDIYRADSRRSTPALAGELKTPESTVRSVVSAAEIRWGTLVLTRERRDLDEFLEWVRVVTDTTRLLDAIAIALQVLDD